MAPNACSDRSNALLSTLSQWDPVVATPWLGGEVSCVEDASDASAARQVGFVTPTAFRGLGAVNRVAVPAMALGAWAVLGFGCATTDQVDSTPLQPSARQTAADQGPSNQSSQGRATPQRVVFADEPTDDHASAPYAGRGSGSGGPTGAQELAGAGLVDALASSYDADRRALADMQSRRSEGRDATSTPPVGTSVPVTAPTTNATEGPNQGPMTTPAATATPGTTQAPAQPQASVTAQAQNPATAPSPLPPVPTGGTAAHPPAPSTSASAPSQPGVTGDASSANTTPSGAPVAGAAQQTASGSTAEQPPSAPVSPSIQANAAVELPPAAPTDPKELSRLLAESLIRTSAESDAPLTQWFAFAALAVGNPDLALPDNFGPDLLEAERARIRKAHAAFSALGRALQEGKTVEKSAQEDLLAALSTGPRIAIPKLDLCTRVEAFGRYSAIANRRFLAGSSPRFIVYSEVEGFTSALEEGKFVTRLATRVSIETERDGVEVWQRSPDWTGSIDASEVRRGEFFLCEIVQLSEHLSVGGYRLKIQVRDEATGEVAVQSLPFHVVADPAMVSVGD